MKPQTTLLLAMLVVLLVSAIATAPDIKKAQDEFRARRQADYQAYSEAAK